MPFFRAAFGPVHKKFKCFLVDRDDRQEGVKFPHFLTQGNRVACRLPEVHVIEKEFLRKFDPLGFGLKTPRIAEKLAKFAFSACENARGSMKLLKDI